MCFIPYCICLGCGRGPFPRPFQRCSIAEQTDLDCYEEDIADDRSNPHLEVDWCEECPPPAYWELPAIFVRVVIRHCFRSVALVPFALWAWVFWSGYVNPFNFRGERLDALGMKSYHLFRASIVAAVGFPCALVRSSEALPSYFTDLVLALPQDIPVFAIFLKDILPRHLIDSSLSLPPDPFCSTTLFRSPNHSRYIPLYDLFAIAKALLGFYLVTKGSFDGPAKTWTIALMATWWCFSKLAFPQYLVVGVVTSLALAKLALAVLQKLGASVFLELAIDAQAVWRVWVFFEAVCALSSLALFLVKRRQVEVPDWPHERQQYLNVANRAVG